MIIQAIAPSFWGQWADTRGRRPVYLLTLMLYSVSNVGLAMTNSYNMLICFRILQAFGASSMIGIGAGTISDITTPDERGSFQGWYSLGFALGPPLGPVIGGVISRYYGWRYIFWFLCLLSAAYWFILFVCLPETLRSRVGTGSGYYANPMLWQWWKHYHHKQQLTSYYAARSDKADGDDAISETHTLYEDDVLSGPTWKRCIAPYFEPLSLAKYKDVLNLVLLYAFQYASNYTVIAMVPAILSGPGYQLDPWTIGYTYLANGGGCFLGSILQGYALNLDYARFSKTNDTTTATTPGRLLERARLRWVLPNALIYNLVIVVYGWCTYIHAPLAALMVIQVVLGITSQCIFNSIQTLLIDLFPTKTASINACNNIFRCLFGAFATISIDTVTSSMGYGWTYSLVSGILLCSRLCVILEIRYGPYWRDARTGIETKRKKTHIVESISSFL
ncbi:unnamed protein product [Absidia cylindrospora]